MQYICFRFFIKANNPIKKISPANGLKKFWIKFPNTILSETGTVIKYLKELNIVVNNNTIEK